MNSPSLQALDPNPANSLMHRPPVTAACSSPANLRMRLLSVEAQGFSPAKLPARLKTALAVASLSLAAAAQQPWQHLSNPTAAEVMRGWQSPPPEYGPEPYYGLNGPVTLDTVRRDLDAMHALGYGAVTVQAGYGMPFAYLSPEYFAFFKQFVVEAKQRNMRVWIVDDAGYPSGFAGGKFSSEHPELRMQALVVAQRIPALSAGSSQTLSLKPEAVALTAVNQSDGTTISIPIQNNSAVWQVPAGQWTILAVEHQFSTSPTRSDTNPQRVKDGSQSLEDYLDPAATAQYLAFTHEQYRKSVGDEFGKTILGFRGDEPDYSIRGLPWTPKFFSRFQAVKGYDIRPFVALLQEQKQTDPVRRAKADYYDVFAMMFRDGFFKPQADWCAANHLEYQVHLNHEEMEMQLTRSEGEFFRDMRFVQVPGIDSIWHQIWTDTISDFPRLASSAAHLDGHPRAFTESFAAYRPAPDLPMVRYILNEQFVRGVNLVETMYYPATSTPGRGGPAKYMQDPAYPALLTYVRRMSYLMSQGRPDANVALLLPSSSMWLGDSASDTQFVSTERLLSEHQIDFDIVDEDFLSTPSMAQAGCPTCRSYSPGKAGKLFTDSGNAYSTVVIPSAAVLSQTALLNLQTFAKGGGKVLFFGRTPGLIAGRTILDARPSTPADFSFASVVSAVLPETPTPPAQPPTSPPAPLVVTSDVARALGKAVSPQEISLDVPDPALRLMRRRLKDAEVVLLFNESGATLTHTMLYAGPFKRASTWDAASGARRDVPLTVRGKGSELSLHLAPYETEVLVLQ